MKYVVTGGAGFVGKAIARALLAQGHEVISLSRKYYPELENLGIKSIPADLGEPSAHLSDAFRGADAVFHVAAKVDMWGAYEEFYRSNVVATRNVMAACRAASVGKLIFTSSPSVVAGEGDLCGVDEGCPYPVRYLANYPQTKAMAEQEILAANGADFATVALRPHLVFGPGDNNFVPTILKRARAGRLMQVGEGKNLTDLCFIDDCVEAHLCALRQLGTNRKIGGKAYFISQGEPVNLWSWIEWVLALHGLPPLRKRISAGAGMAIATVAEFLSRCLPFIGEPLLTKFLVHEMTTHHYFNISRAQELLQFRPRYSVAGAMEATFGTPGCSRRVLRNASTGTQ